MTLARRNASPVASGIDGAGSLPGVQAGSPRTSPSKVGASISVCPELTAYITTLLAVVGAIAWAHVFAMGNTLVDQLINFHPRVMFCDAVGTKAGFVCAVRHKEGE